jgi:Tol biopolymer transport system component
VADIEQFRLIVDGRTLEAKDRNMWLTALREDVECPSLSPDHTRIAFKKRGDLPRGHWRLAVYDLATGRETLLAEQRSVDDQVEWSDNTTIVYGMPRIAPNGADTADIWTVPADGSGAARVFVHNAWSPAVVR